MRETPLSLAVKLYQELCEKRFRELGALAAADAAKGAPWNDSKFVEVGEREADIICARVAFAFRLDTKDIYIAAGVMLVARTMRGNAPTSESIQ